MPDAVSRPPPAGRVEFHDGEDVTVVDVRGDAGARRFAFDAGDLKRDVVEHAGERFADTGSTLLDGLFALALDEVRECSVSSINALAFRHGETFAIEAFETGELWQYVWTRDLAYAADLSLAGLDTPRVIRSLLYKTSGFKAATGLTGQQILQDTGSGGSYPVSTDRVVWALAAARVVHFLDAAEQAAWIERTLPILTATIEQDRRLVFNPATGLYRGEQSFLDWREQTYPTRTRDNTLEIATSEALSTNVTHYVILHTAADFSRRTGDAAAADRYGVMADALKAAINEKLFDEEAGLYAAYLLTDLTAPLRVHRYDLLGQSLAVLTGVADATRANLMLDRYPTGPHGPSVVWPQESTVPIYHNHAIWPFVTAYWAKAAKAAGHEAVVAAAVRSLVRGAAINLSNMENLDWAGGQISGDAHGLTGPAINSRRQLWSVAGFVSAVQDVLFGMETTADGVRFVPCVPAGVRADFFADAAEIHLRRVAYRGRRIDVTVSLPPATAGRRLAVDRVTLNGREIGPGFFAADALADRNTWRVEMKAVAARVETLVTFTAFDDARAVFGPPTPAWHASVGQGGLAVVDGRVRLHYEAVGDRHVMFNVYRDGQCVARQIAETEWTDPQSGDHDRRAAQYAVEAVYAETGHHSYPTATRSYDPAASLTHPHRHPSVACGAAAVTLKLIVHRAGRHVVQLSYSNGSGAINTGITCAVKRVRLTFDDRKIAAGHVVLPQTGGPQMFQLSSPLEATFPAASEYAVHVEQDDASLNMSYFAHNEHYTGHEGGGVEPYNEIRVDAARAKWLGGAGD